MKILIIDGMGGGIGKSIAKTLLDNLEDNAAEIIGIGTNSLATSALIKGGIKTVATGENPIVYNSKDADFILGPFGIIIPNSMYGEITTEMALAITGSNAKKFLVPISNEKIFIGSKTEKPLNDLITDTVSCFLEVFI